jgi:MFS family permease
MVDQFLAFFTTSQGSISMGALLGSLLIASFVSFALSWHYIRFGRTYSNRRELAQVFPILMLATVLIISIVQSSIALSLGLVGALSIVRFRTPIKEPEELAYLFVAIALGIGIGAGQIMITVMAAAVIMVVLVLRSGGRQIQPSLGLLVNVEVSSGSPNDHLLREINGFVVSQAPGSSLRRVDVREGMLQATYFVVCNGPEKVISLMAGLAALAPDAAISFIEQGGLPGR